MKLAEIQVGQEYLTEVSGRRVRVRVTGMRQETGYGYRSGAVTRTKFRCQCVDTGAYLPKSRTPAALHPVRTAGGCVLCGVSVSYPEGVRLRSGREVHVGCVQAWRAARAAACP